MTLSELPNIVEISANNLTQLTHINASTFASNLKLTKLNLRNNVALQAIDPAAFSPQSTLKEVVPHIKPTTSNRLNFSSTWTTPTSPACRFLSSTGHPSTASLYRVHPSRATATSSASPPRCLIPPTTTKTGRSVPTPSPQTATTSFFSVATSVRQKNLLTKQKKTLIVFANPVVVGQARMT